MSRRGRRKSPSDLLPELARAEPLVPRRLRVEGDVHQCLIACLRKMGDPRLRDVTVTRVEMTDDLQQVRVYVRGTFEVETSQGSGVSKQAMMKGLAAAASRLRQEVGRMVALRYTPRLQFRYDDGLEAQARVDELLEEIASDDRSRDDAVDDGADPSVLPPQED